jgi:hypothetical protein
MTNPNNDGLLQPQLPENARQLWCLAFALGAQVLKGFGLRIGGLPRGGDGHDDKVVWLVFDNGFSVCFKHLGDGAAVCNLLAVAPQQDVLI